MKFLVTEVEFDLQDDYDMSKDDRLEFNELQIELEDQTVGIWEADDEDDLIEEITTASGWCIKSICNSVGSIDIIPTKSDKVSLIYFLSLR